MGCRRISFARSGSPLERLGYFNSFFGAQIELDPRGSTDVGVPAIAWNVRTSNMDMSRYGKLSRSTLGVRMGEKRPKIVLGALNDEISVSFASEET